MAAGRGGRRPDRGRPLGDLRPVPVALPHERPVHRRGGPPDLLTRVPPWLIRGIARVRDPAGGGRDRHDPPRPSQDERDQRAAAHGGARRGHGGREAGRRPRRRPLRRRAGVRRRRRHQGDVPARRHGHGGLGPRADRTPSPQVARIPKPVIAAVTGYALGGGYELALCADFRVLGAGAKIGQPEILLGVIPGAGGTQRLARLVGPAKAKDLVFTGRHVGAEEALEIGLADAVVPDDEVYSTAIAMAAQVRRRAAAGPGRREAGDRRGARPAAGRGAGAGEPAVRRAVRHRGPEDRHALVPRERPRQGGLHRSLSSVRPAARRVHHTFVCRNRP